MWKEVNIRTEGEVGEMGRVVGVERQREREGGRGKCGEESIREKGGDRGGGREGGREEVKRVGERERGGERRGRGCGGGE